MATFNGYVIGGALNVRASCSTSSTRLTQIPNGTTINVSAVSGQNEWFQTSYGGYTGYVQSRYIAITNDGGTCTVTTSSGSLNVRVKPQSGATRIYTAAQYSTLRLLDYTSVSGWYRVSNSSGSGWAQSQFLTITAYPGGGGTGGGDGSGGDSGNGTWTYRIINHSDYVNIRETANGSIIGRLYPGDPLVYYAGVTYSAGGNDWYKIKFDGDAYIRASYVSLDTANHTIVDTFSYCPNKAVTYGYNHTDNTGSSTSCPNHNTEFGYIQRGDCANFVSQCLCAGGLPMFKGWSYQVNGISSNWSEYNWKHTNATRCALLAKERIKSIDYTEVQKGDIIFNYSSTNSNYNERFDHVVIAADDFNQATSTCKVHGHTQNKRDWDKPLNSSNCKCYHVLPEIKVEYCERKFLLPETGNGASPQ